MLAQRHRCNFNVSKIAVPKMTSNLESPSAVGNVGTALCTRSEPNEVSFGSLGATTVLIAVYLVVQFEAR
jgi:hypothetical protein